MQVDRKLIERVRKFMKDHEWCNIDESGEYCWACAAIEEGKEHNEDCEWQSLAQALDALLDDKVPF
jgi:hypothetical protein